MSFFKLFKYNEEYPENIAERGAPQDTLYEYVSTTFLNGFINYVKIFFVCVIERYVIWDENPDCFEAWNGVAKDFHPDYSHIGDDVLILAESPNSFWFFWSDQDSSDCMIGRFAKEEVEYVRFIGPTNEIEAAKTGRPIYTQEEVIQKLKDHIIRDRITIDERKTTKWPCGEPSMEMITGRYHELPLPTGWVKL